MSQAALAGKAKVSREYINRLEAGRNDPTLGVLQGVAKALGVSVRELGGTPRERLLERLLRARMAGRTEAETLVPWMRELADDVERFDRANRFRAKDLRAAKTYTSLVDMHLTQLLDELTNMKG